MWSIGARSICDRILIPPKELSHEKSLLQLPQLVTGNSIPRRLRVWLLHGIEAFEFDARVRCAELPVDRAHSLVAVILPALNLLTKLLNRGDVVRQTLPRQHTQFDLGDVDSARMFGRVVDL